MEQVRWKALYGGGCDARAGWWCWLLLGSDPGHVSLGRGCS